MSLLRHKFDLLRIKGVACHSNVPISTSFVNFFGEVWRQSKGLPANVNRDPVLRDIPDYTFVDGRPTPYGARHWRRIMKQREYTAKIVTLTEEMDLAQRLHQERLAKKKAEDDERLARKLKAKGEKTLNP